MLYNNLSSYLKSKYGKRLSKICIDGGFTCPNRDGIAGVGGCIYCTGRGSGDHIPEGLDVRAQVEAALRGRGENEEFIAYFQSFTNTYAPCDRLARIYGSALIDRRIRVLAIGTRPDCISEEVAELIASFLDRVDVWVELGLQTASDKSADIINRCYKTEVYVRACEILHRYGIPFVTHIMIGLLGEGETELCDTVALVNSTRPFGVKIHSVYVPRGTVLAEMYGRGEYVPIDRETYVRRAAYAISHLHPDTVLHRITGDCPRELLVAPEWNADKNGTIAAINAYLSEHGMRQGSEWQP